eukprot:77920-Heterocapsa_arctica.AAC.1
MAGWTDRETDTERDRQTLVYQLTHSMCVALFDVRWRVDCRQQGVKLLWSFACCGQMLALWVELAWEGLRRSALAAFLFG